MTERAKSASSLPVEPLEIAGHVPGAPLGAFALQHVRAQVARAREPALFLRGRFGVMIIGREPGARWRA